MRGSKLKVRIESYFVRIQLPEGVSGEARDAFSALVTRLSALYSFQGLEDWSVDLRAGEKVLGVEAEFHDLRGLGKMSREMRVYFGSKAHAGAFRSALLGIVEGVPVSAPRALAKRDWMKEWRRHYKVQKLREAGLTLWIVPAWKKAPRGGLAVRIYPGQAFGTGTHATTRLCLRLFLKHAREAGRVLDFGAGTGVLAIAASLLGFRGVAVESDRVALEQCRVNLRLNKVRMPARRAMGRGKYELVFANVLSPVLLAERARLKAAVEKGGLLILSGILAKEARAFLRKFGMGGFRLVELATQGDWAAIAILKK